MGISDFWLQSNNGKKISLENLKELKKSDLEGNSALLNLFNIFDTQNVDGTKGSDGVLNKEELTSLFNTMQKTAQSSKGKDTSIFETEEAEEFISSTKTAEGKSLKELGVKTADVFTLLSKLVKTQNAPMTVDNMPLNINLTEEQAKEEVLSIIANDAAEARTLLSKQDNGKVSDLYNKYKEWRDDDLSLSNIEEAIMLQEDGAENLYKAKVGKLSKREYFLQNREHLKTMMKRRLFRKDENTGLDFLDRNRGKMSKDEFAKFMEEYINSELDKIDRLDSLQQLKHTLLVTTEAGTEYIRELKASQPLTPVTQIPTTDMIMSKVGSVDPDGKARDKAGNIIDGLYVRQSDGLVIIKHNEVTDWEALGFSEGTTSKGITGVGKTRIKGKNTLEEDYETGNIHYFMHGLDYPNQLMKFEAFPLVDSRVMLSLTYLERPESKPRGFRPQGILLDFRTKYIYGGGETDMGSGCGKFVDEFVKDYCFGGHRQKDRTMVSDLIKEATGMTDEEYIKFVEENKNKQWSEVEPPELRNKLIKALADGIVSTERGYKRSYDEFYGSNPERVMATFAYNEDAAQLIGNAVEFVENNNHRLNYLIQFNRDHKIPMVLLGD